MAFSSNDLYPVVYDLKDFDHAKKGSSCRKSTAASYKEKATMTATSILSSTIFCGHDVTLNNSNQGDYIFFKRHLSEQMDVSNSDQEPYIKELPNHRRQAHHRSQWQSPSTSHNCSQQFVQSSQSTTNHILLAEEMAHSKHRQLEDDYVLTQQVGQEKKGFSPRLYLRYTPGILTFLSLFL
jgi:hypothetical protein